MTTDSYDLVVIGAGSGGVRAARMAATYGAKVAIVEEFRVGGTCVIRGCVPKKLYVYASRFHDMFDVASSFGWQVDASFDWPTLVANKEKEITRLEMAYTANLEKPGVEIIKDRAVVTGPNAVHLVGQGRDLTAKYILVATGGHPYIPPIPGAELGITSNEAFDLPALPHSILIEGGGYIAVEFATIFAGLGVNTTIIQTTIKSLARQGDDIVATFSDGVSAPYGAVMFATGRAPNVKGLGLDTAGVKLTAMGAVAVDAYSQSSVPSIYAVGDVTGRAALTPVAIREGWYFAETVFNNNPLAVDHSQIPTAVFSDPEIGVIGLTETEAATHGDIDVYVARFRPMMNTLSTRTERMILKLIVGANGGKVLGCHILGPGAAEMIQLVAIPMGMGATKADFDRAIALHPSAAEELVTFKAPSYTYRNGAKVGG
jgi:glutathione reductase (NADPH)